MSAIPASAIDRIEVLRDGQRGFMDPSATSALWSRRAPQLGTYADARTLTTWMMRRGAAAYIF